MHKVEHTQQLPHALLPARGQPVVLHHQVSVDLVVVVAYVQPCNSQLLGAALLQLSV